MELEDARLGTSVLIRSDYRDPHRQGAEGTIKKRHGTPDYRVFEVSFPDGRAELFWDHQLVDPENLVKRSFKPLLKKAGLPEIRFHDLRHTCATLLLGRSVHPQIVQELLGHATIAMTLDTYSHYLPSMGDRAAGAMGDALG
jgi:integrase